MPSVTTCTLTRVQQSASWDILGRATHALSYDIVTDGVMSPAAIRAQAESASPHPLPSYGSTYSYQGTTDTNAYAMGFEIVSRDSQQKLLRATVTFQPPPEDDATIFEPNPFLRDPVVWFDRESYNVFISHDKFGNEIVNFCNRRYDLGVEKQRHRPVLVVEFNKATLGEVGVIVDTFNDATNAIPWTIFGWTVPSRCAFCQDISASPPITQGAFTYFHLAMRFIFDFETFDEPLVERGFQCFHKTGDDYDVDANGDKVLGAFVDDSFVAGGVSPEAFLLNEDGTKAPDGQEGIQTAWRINKEVNFNTLTG